MAKGWHMQTPDTEDPLQPVDYPKGGIESPEWTKVTPDDPSAWNAFTYSGKGGCTNYFLGAGETDLEVNIALGTAWIKCLKGYVYLIQRGRVMALPAQALGYLQCLTSEGIVAFCGFSDLLVIDSDGVIRYDPSAAIDNLTILDIHHGYIALSGMRQYVLPEEGWTVKVADVPHFVDLES
ncbi:MAG TPA: hypothetical protein PLH94_09075 [Fimbriimonadaceae bacterium]|nr:hypothetical protein [Fimbriimonadaceae bacterium]